MRNYLSFCLLLLSCVAVAQTPAEKYKVDSASVVHAGVPKGELLKFSFASSKIYPGTIRDYWIYVPAQYRPDKPACVYVSQDGVQSNAPVVFDNLIFSKAMPITIGVFVSPGVVKTMNAGTGVDRYNRSFEYDGLGDTYAKFILEEIFPAVEQQKTADGRVIHLSKSGNDRAIGGASSGAICAFNAAWEMPGEFSRVFSAIGTYIGLRGADRFPTLIRKYEPRPLRIFLQDGSADLNIYAGDWWMANQTMERALSFAGYEVQHAWGEGGHNGQMAASVFPEAMRWLWKDWPKPVAKGNSKNQFLADLLLPGEDWQLVGEGYKFTEGTAVDVHGTTFFQDIPNFKTYKINAAGKPEALAVNSKRAAGTAYGPDGKRYAAAAETKQVLRYDANDQEQLVADTMNGNDLVVAANGNVYVTVPNGADKPGSLYMIKPDGSRAIVDVGLKFPNGIALTPDQTQLYVTESASHWVWIYSIQPGGMLTNKQRYGWLHVPDNQENAWSDGLKCDTAGRVYVTSRIGIQVMDQMGRVNAIIPVPSGQSSNCVFGGPAFNILYVSCGDKVYRRKLKTRGANAFEAPVRPVNPRM